MYKYLILRQAQEPVKEFRSETRFLSSEAYRRVSKGAYRIRRTNLISFHVESKDMNLASNNLTFESKHLNVASKHLDIESMDMNVASKLLDIESKDMNVASKLLTFANRHLALAGKHINVTSKLLTLESRVLIFGDLSSHYLFISNENEIMSYNLV